MIPSLNVFKNLRLWLLAIVFFLVSNGTSFAPWLGDGGELLNPPHVEMVRSVILCPSEGSSQIPAVDRYLEDKDRPVHNMSDKKGVVVIRKSKSWNERDPYDDVRYQEITMVPSPVWTESLPPVMVEGKLYNQCRLVRTLKPKSK